MIFHGINTDNYFKKGSDIFEEALQIIQSKYSDIIEIRTVRSIPYNEYISSYHQSHIILDQVYNYDQGYNALEAMAKGKVVFTGAEKEWRIHYGNDENTVAITTKPDTQYIVDKLEWLITNPHKIEEISNNARRFIENYHNYLKVAQLYLDAWENV